MSEYRFKCSNCGWEIKTEEKPEIIERYTDDYLKKLKVEFEHEVNARLAIIKYEIPKNLWGKQKYTLEEADWDKYKTEDMTKRNPSGKYYPLMEHNRYTICPICGARYYFSSDHIL